MRFCKVTFSVTVFTGYVSTVGQIGNKSLRFQKRKKRIRLDGALVHLVDCANRWNIFYGIWVVIKTTFTLLSGVLFSHLCLPSETEGRVRTLSLVLTNLRFISNQVINLETSLQVMFRRVQLKGLVTYGWIVHFFVKVFSVIFDVWPNRRS